MKHLTPEIREASLSDLESLTPLFQELDALHVELMPETFRHFEGPTRPIALLEERVTSTDKAIFVAIHETRTIGFIDIQKSSNPPYPMFIEKNFALVDNLFVLSEFRGTGVAHSLFERAKHWASEHGLSSLQLKVYNNNQAAIRFYQREGLVPLNTTFQIEW